MRQFDGQIAISEERDCGRGLSHQHPISHQKCGGHDDTPHDDPEESSWHIQHHSVVLIVLNVKWMMRMLENFGSQKKGRKRYKFSYSHAMSAWLRRLRFNCGHGMDGGSDKGETGGELILVGDNSFHTRARLNGQSQRPGWHGPIEQSCLITLMVSVGTCCRCLGFLSLALVSRSIE